MTAAKLVRCAKKIKWACPTRNTSQIWQKNASGTWKRAGCGVRKEFPKSKQVICLKTSVGDNDVMFLRHIASSLAVGLRNVKDGDKIVPWNQER